MISDLSNEGLGTIRTGVRVVEIVPVRVGDTVPVAVVEIVPVRVVEIVPTRVVEIVPFLESAVNGKANINTTLPSTNFELFIDLLLSSNSVNVLGSANGRCQLVSKNMPIQATVN
jgi:hypothetical protein